MRSYEITTTTSDFTQFSLSVHVENMKLMINQYSHLLHRPIIELQYLQSYYTYITASFKMDGGHRGTEKLEKSEIRYFQRPALRLTNMTIP